MRAFAFNYQFINYDADKMHTKTTIYDNNVASIHFIMNIGLWNTV